MNKEKSIKILNELVNHLGITVNQLSESIGKGRSQWAYDVLNPKKKVGISKNIAELISNKYPEINRAWLLGVDDNMLLAGEAIKQEDGRIAPTAVSPIKTAGAVPFYGDLPVSAGQQNLATVLENMKSTGWMDIPGLSKSIGAFPVIGCSMEPDIRQGDFVCIAEMDRWESIDPDKIYMIITRDDRMIKHLALDKDNKDILWCISPNYPTFKVYKSEILAIYRITFHGRCT